MNNNDRWILTHSGKKFFPFSPNVADIEPLDIAHGLSLRCRFQGQCDQFYSVAQHSLCVMQIVPRELRLPALLHDAAEAYLPDVPRPIKCHIPGWRDIEERVEFAIAFRFGFNPALLYHDEIKKADNIMLATEFRDIMPAYYNTDLALPEPAIDRTVTPLPWQHAKQQFIMWLEELVNA